MVRMQKVTAVNKNDIGAMKKSINKVSRLSAASMTKYVEATSLPKQPEAFKL